MSQIYLITVLGDDHRIIPGIGSLLWSVIIKIRILTDDIRSVTGINHCHCFVSGDHIIDHIISCIDRIHGITLVDQPFISFLNLTQICGIHGVSKCFQGDHKGISFGIVHVKISFIFLIGKNIPALSIQIFL